jgi:uncharacterized protein YuzE
MRLYYQYDEAADVLYISEGKPSAKDVSEEASNDVVLRLDKKSHKVKGFTILNFAKRGKNKPVSLPLPIKELFKELPPSLPTSLKLREPKKASEGNLSFRFSLNNFNEHRKIEILFMVW